MCLHHPQILTPQKLSSPLGLFGLTSFNGFVIAGDGRIDSIAILVFYLVIKIREIFSQIFSCMFLALLHLLKGEEEVGWGNWVGLKVPKNWVEGGTNVLKKKFKTCRGDEILSF